MNNLEIEEAVRALQRTHGQDDIYLIRDGHKNFRMSGIFQSYTKSVDGYGVVASTSDPYLEIWESDLPEEISNRFKFKIDERIYSIRDIERDGHGNLQLELYNYAS